MASKGDSKTSGTAARKQEQPAGEPTINPRFLHRFLFGLVLSAALVSAGFWLSSAWGYLAVVKPAQENLAKGTDEALKQTLLVLEDPHIFAGFDPYHGFGDENASRRYQRVEEILARGASYSPREEHMLKRGIAYFITAFKATKIEGDVPVVTQDRAIIESLLERWSNALRSGIIFAIHATLVTLLLSGLSLVYRRFNLFERIRPLSQGD